MISVNMFVPNSKVAFSFYKKVFNAVALHTMFEAPIGERNAKFKINDSLFAIADENLNWGSKSPITLGGVPMCIQLFVDDVQKYVNQAVIAGCKIVPPGTDNDPIFATPDGLICSNLCDPFGFIWSITNKK